MGLFVKRCSVCDRKLPDKRMFKGVCDRCGMDFKRIKRQLEETCDIVESTKNPITGYDRCLLGLGLTDDFRRFVDAKLSRFPRGNTFEEQRDFFISATSVFVKEIRAKNEKRKYSKKVGFPSLDTYKRLYNSTSKTSNATVCKGCWEAGKRLNDAGYCPYCLARATTITLSDFKELVNDGLVNIGNAAPETVFKSVGDKVLLQLILLKLDKAKAKEAAKKDETTAKSNTAITIILNTTYTD